MKSSWWVNPWRLLAFRFFLAFWLVMALTVTVAVLLAHTVQDDTDIRRLPPGLEDEVKHLLRGLNRFDTLEELNQRLNRRDRNRWLVVDPENNQILNGAILPEDFNRQWLTELSQLNRPRLLIHRKVVLAGPFLVMFHDRPLALYQQRPRPDDAPLLAFLPKYTLPLLLLFFSLIAAVGVALTLSRPLRQLQQKNLQFASGDLTTRAGSLATRQDELGELARGFDEMAVKISDLLENQQRLLRDISHDLRTPLTRAQLAIALEQRQQTGEQLPRLSQELERIDQLLAELLTFSRLDAGQYQTNLQPLDLVDLLDELIQLNQLEASQRQQRIVYQGPAHCQVLLDSMLLGRALENIVRNAMKYSPEHTDILVSVSLFAHEVELAVTDQGPGIPPDALQRIFEPFYRVSDSRNSATGGTGLGLAIAAQAVKQHKGRIQAQLPSHGGLRIVMVLPRLPESPASA